MKIELKNVKYAAFASEETSCFEATIYIDGNKAGRAYNEGRGGPTSIEPRELEARMAAYAATLPQKTATLGGNYGDFTYTQTSESLVDDLLDDHLARQDLTRLLKRIAIKLPADKPGIFRKVGTAALKPTPEHLAAVAKQFPQAIILNQLPFDEALALYRSR